EERLERPPLLVVQHPGLGLSCLGQRMTAVHTKMRRNKFESATAGALVLPISLPVFNLQEPLVLYRGLHLRPRRAGQDRALARGRERRSIAACAAVVKDVG
ncbi:unnamed protein product, partial [Ectocarpus sp. 12 AP-2014]